MLQSSLNLCRRQSVHESKRHASYFKTRIQPLSSPNDETSKITPDNQQNVLKDAIAPLWNVPYIEQLQMKDEWVSNVVTQYFSILLQQLTSSRREKSSPNFRKPSIAHIFPSPIIHQYRSKDVYMVRPGVDGNPKTVGHIIGRPSLCQYVCVPPVDILSPSRHTEVAKVFQDYIRSSALPACINFSEGGNWTQIQVRSNRKGDTMALVKLHPQDLTKAQIEEECLKLREFFESGPGSSCQLSSLYCQASPYSNASGKQAPFQLLYGERYLMETLNGREFALSPGSFFQSNVRMAEILYEKIFLASKLSSLSSVLDLGCGIGTISILSTPPVRCSVGIDSSEEAIEDAKFNARLNNIFTANFVAGKIESKINRCIEWLDSSSDIVAILNPGRCGVEVSVIKALRSIPQIGKVIYVACQPDHEWVIRNVLHLIKPKTHKTPGSPFHFNSVIPIDMFPQTLHCELIMKFER